MKHSVGATGLILTVLLLAGCASDSGRNMEGIWEGNLQFPGIEMRIVFKISSTPEGTFTAVMLRPELEDGEFPVSTVIVLRDSLHLQVAPGDASFEGRIRSDGSAIDGQWIHREFTQPLILNRVSGVHKPRRPQEPEPPYPYEEEDVAYANLKAWAKLAGTLTYPRKGGPFPAVLLVSGGGAQNRDGLILGHRPFLVMADYLTRQGIVVLRVDDRGVGASTGDRSRATAEDYAQDALAGVEFLKKRPEVDPQRIGLIGHSEGGTVASLAAAQSGDIAFIVMLASPGLPGEEYNYQFEESMNRALGQGDEALDSILAVQKRVFDVLKTEKDTAAARVKLRRILENLEPPMPEEMIEGNLERYLSPWFKYSISYDPAPTLNKVKCPVLALFGEKDIHVPPEGNLERIEQALKEGANPDYRVEVLSGLNHLFQTAETGAPSEYVKIEETIALKALRLIGNWVLEHTKKQ